MPFAIKVEIYDPRAKTFALSAQKTMYGGKHIAKGDTVFVFASENQGGKGLVARGVVTSAEAISKKRGIARQTPRVSIAVKRTALAKRPLGRSELKRYTDWKDGKPETELNFKLYRQASNKSAGYPIRRRHFSIDSSSVSHIANACGRLWREAAVAWTRVIGLLTSFFNRRSLLCSGLRQVGIGAAAAALTYAIGRGTAAWMG